MRPILILAAALALAGCADFRMGAACYLPANHIGECSVRPSKIEIEVKPAAPAASGVSA
jgi:hypothetical protein